MIDRVRYSYTPAFLDLLMKQSNGKAFRKKIDPCPYCEPNCGVFEKPKFAVEWDREGIVREIVFIRNQMGPYYKKGYVIMVSACPRCNKLSFHHRSITWLFRDDWADKKVVQAEIDAWERESIAEWDESLCKRCAVEKLVEKDPFGYVVRCTKGYSSPENPKESTVFRCKSFVPAVPNTCFFCGELLEGEEKQHGIHETCAKAVAEVDRVAHEEWVAKMKGLGIEVS